MDYKLGALIGALGGGNQQVTTTSFSAFGTTIKAYRFGNLVHLDCTSRSTGTVNPAPAGTIPVGFRPAYPQLATCYYVDISSDYEASFYVYPDGSMEVCIIDRKTSLKTAKQLSSGTTKYVSYINTDYIAA
jgi:hypothetical protein